MVSKARLDFPDPDRPVMQISAFRGSRTVMSLRLCSRAPWTTSSSTAIRRQSSGRTGVRVTRLLRPEKGDNRSMGETARKSFVATIVALAVVVGAFALWQLKVLVALILLAIVIASAMRPGVEWLHRKRVPRAAGVAIHY